MKKALILTGNLVQDHEFIYPYYRVQEEGYDVDVAVRGGEQVNGIIGIKVVPTKDIPDLKVDEYDLLILPGGAKAMEYMRQDDEILKFISDFNASGKVIASICHAAQLLISAKIVDGKRGTQASWALLSPVYHASWSLLAVPLRTHFRARLLCRSSQSKPTGPAAGSPSVP